MGRTAPLGELVAAAFDGASRYSTDPREVSRLAIGAVTYLLRFRAPAAQRESGRGARGGQLGSRSP